MMNIRLRDVKRLLPGAQALSVALIATIDAEERDERQREEPDDVEVEPVRRGELDGDQHRGAERGYLQRRLAARDERDRDGEQDGEARDDPAVGLARVELAPDAERRAARSLVSERAV